MKKIHVTLLMLACLALAFVACSSEEDTTPSNIEVNKFAPADNDHSELAEYRRDFHKNTGTYLLFDDRGVLDVQYNMFGSNSDSYLYTFDYLEGFEQQKQAAEHVQRKVLRRLGASSPFAVLIVDSIRAWRYNKGVLKESKKGKITYYLGSQCHVFSMEKGAAFKDSLFFDNLIAQIVLSKVNAKGDAFLKEFFALVPNYDDYQNKDKAEMGIPEEYNDSLARTMGFLRDGSKYYFRSKKGDIEDYVTALFTYTPAKFKETFAIFPICLARYDKMKELVRSLGVVFDEE